jgi:hypothetical protein
VVLCLAVSVIPRGIQTGINDHFSYYSAFLKEFKEGRVITTNSNHTLKSLVLKAFYPETRNVEDINPLLYKKPMLIANMMLLLLAGLTTGMCVYARKTKKKVNYLIIFSLIFIFTHLISGITWTAHLVTAMFWYLPLFIVDVRKITHTAHKILHYLFYAMAFFLTVEGKDTTGEFLYNVLSFYDVLVIFPLVLFFYYIYLEFRHFRFIEYSHA